MIVNSLISLLLGGVPGQVMASGVRWEIKLKNPTKVFFVHALGHNQNSFSASTAPKTSLNNVPHPLPNDKVTGGFSSPISLAVGFGTRVRNPLNSKINELINNNSSRYNAYKNNNPNNTSSTLLNDLKSHIRNVAYDKYIFRALNEFVTVHGNEIDATDTTITYSGITGDGFYIPKTNNNTKSKIKINMLTQQGGVENTLIHEILHYIFDQEDSILNRQRVMPDGTIIYPDHPVIEIILAKTMLFRDIMEGRFHLALFLSLEGDNISWSLLESIFYGSSGTKYDLDTSIVTDFDKHLTDPAKNPKLNKFNHPDREKRKEYYESIINFIDKPEFINNIISLGLLPFMLVEDTASQAGHGRIYNNVNIQDIAFILAQIAVVVRRMCIQYVLTCEAKEVTINNKTEDRRTQVPANLIDAGAEINPSNEWKNEMKKFLRCFINELQDNPTQDVVGLEKQLRNPINCNSN